MSDWNSGAPAPPETIEGWINVISRQLNDLTASPKGFGRRAWTDATIPAGFVEEYPFLPGYRWTQDGRIELRGRVKKGTWSTATPPVFTAQPINNNDVVLLLPYECAPPHNKQGVRSSVSVVGLASVGSNSSGVCRFDIELEATWRTVPVMDGEGKPMVDGNGDPVTKPSSYTEIRARPGSGAAVSGWVGFDQVVFDARLYLDALPPVAPGQDPLVPEPGVAIFQRNDGTIQEITPGVEYDG